MSLRMDSNVGMGARRGMRAMTRGVYGLVLGALALPAVGYWPVNPAVNVPISTKPSEQTLPKVAVAPDGSVYVGFHDSNAGNYDMYLQRLTKNGDFVFAENGIPVSTHPQGSSLVDWAMIAAANGDAILVFTDTRDGSDRDVFAYRVGPAGEQRWGADGVTLSVNDNFEAAPVVAELSDGHVAVVWSRSNAAPVPPGLMAQVLDADGVPQHEAPVMIAGSGTDSPAFAQVVPGDNGSFIVLYLRDTTSFASPRHLRVQKFSGNAEPLWNGGAPIEVYNQASLPIGYTPKLLSDEAGGAVIGWHRSFPNRFDCLVQRVAADGTVLFPEGGAFVSTDMVEQHFDISIAYDANTQETYAIWNNRNSTQSQWGIRAQKFDSAGNRQWGDFGVEIEPINGTNKSLPRAASREGGFVGLYLYATGPVTDEIRAVRLNADGDAVWTPGIRDIATAVSDKSRIPVDATPDGGLVVAWEDDRNGNRDLYAQHILAGGGLGVLADLNCDGVVTVSDIGPMVQALTNPAEYVATWPDCDIRLADANGDGAVTVSDIGGLVEALTNP
jgi:hypothetical protein